MEPSGYSLIVVGTDGSKTAGRAVTQAISVAERFGSHLVIVCVYEPAPEAQVQAEKSAVSAELQWLVDPLAQANSLLDHAADEARAAGISCETIASPGRPAEEIVKIATQRQADLIVVGNKGIRSRRLLPSSIQHLVIDHAHCSVLIAATVERQRET